MSPRNSLDRLLALDATASVAFGLVSLLAPHTVLAQLGDYNHAVHETIRLYACLRLAVGWLLWNVRTVDDGIFRRRVCEALGFCYGLQALVVLRAQFTDTAATWVNWGGAMVLVTMTLAYASFRLGKGGNLIKVYQLPTNAK